MKNEKTRPRVIPFKSDIRVQFGEKVRTLRMKQKKFIGDVAHDAQISESYLGMVERGERNISIDKIDGLAKALKVKPKDLFDF